MFKRSLLVILGVAAFVNGGIMVAQPAEWYAAVPGVEYTGPFNAHSVLDIGLAFVAAGGGLLLAAWKAALWPAAVTGAAFLGLHGGLHVVELARGDGHAPIAFEIFMVVLPSALAIYAAWPSPARRAS